MEFLVWSPSRAAVWTLGAAVVLASACGGGDSAPAGAGGGPFVLGTGGGAGFVINPGVGGGAATYGDSGIPPGTIFTPGEYGAYALGQALTGQGLANTGITAENQACNTIAGVVRDFMGAGSPENGHPDFETFAGTNATPGMVQNAIGGDGKPVYTGVCQAPGVTAACPYSQQTTSKDAFDQWYRFTDGVNKPYLLYLQFTPLNGKMTFQSHTYFPVDGTGWGNAGRQHNYHFTTEIHTKFRYGGGESFEFLGDDDVWVFINGKLAVDLGGLHTETRGTINVDTLGLTVGTEYTLDLFHAERHTSLSNFRIDTNFAFTDCGTIIPADIR